MILKLIGRETWNALKVMLVLLLLCVVIYPLIVFGLGQLAFNHQANGSLITDSKGNVVGSALIGQQFSLPIYFQGRPSAVGYNAAGSGASNIGPTNPQLLSGNGSNVTVSPKDTPPAGGIEIPGTPGAYYVPGSYLGIQNYAVQFRQLNGLAADAPLPADIVTASGSGLDPNISVDAANLQVNRLVTDRKALGGNNAAITADEVMALIKQNTDGRDLGVLGEPRVNVLTLNIALDAKYGAPPAATPVMTPSAAPLGTPGK